MAAATYSQLGTISGQQDFQNRVAIAMSNAAMNVYSEGTGVTGHTARAAYANKVLNGTYNLQASALAVLAGAAIMAEATITPPNGIPDADIQNQVNALWNALAGA